jgi:hypothetical protein
VVVEDTNGYLIRKIKMVEILQWLFVTERDQLIYSNKNKLFKEMVEEYEFDEEQVSEVLSWFEPITFEYQNLIVSHNLVRELSEWEKKFVPSSVIEKVLSLESDKTISSLEREILFDRLGELCLDYAVATDEMDVIFDGLLNHMKNYGGANPLDNTQNNTYYWMNNTVH